MDDFYTRNLDRLCTRIRERQSLDNPEVTEKYYCGSMLKQNQIFCDQCESDIVYEDTTVLGAS